MQTFYEQYTELQTQTGDTSVAKLALFKSWINRAVGLLRTDLGREYTKETITANIVASQQYYQLPEDCIRPSSISIISGTQRYTPKPVYSERNWRLLNSSTSETGSIPTHRYLRGKDEVGFLPIPSANITSGLEISYTPRVKDMTQADYAIGTITVTNGDDTITGAGGATFTAQMVGRYFHVTDDSDGLWYRIGAYVSGTELTLENYYEGSSGAAKTYKIGEMAQVPEEFNEAPLDYAFFRFFMGRKDSGLAAEYKSLWDGARDMAKEMYANPDDSQVIHSGGRQRNVYEDTYDDNMTLS